MTPEVKRETFIRDNVADIAPVPCGINKGDVVTFINEYGLKFKGLRVLGFVREIDPEWRPDSVIYLDKSAYWFPVAESELTLECRAEDVVVPTIIEPVLPEIDFCH